MYVSTRCLAWQKRWQTWNPNGYHNEEHLAFFKMNLPSFMYTDTHSPAGDLVKAGTVVNGCDFHWCQWNDSHLHQVEFGPLWIRNWMKTKMHHPSSTKLLSCWYVPCEVSSQIFPSSLTSKGWDLVIAVWWFILSIRYTTISWISGCLQWNTEYKLINHNLSLTNTKSLFTAETI